MDRAFENMRRLDVRGLASRGVAVDTEGATLGPDCMLVRRTAAGYRCLRREEAAMLQKVLFSGEEDAPDRLFTLSHGIARALGRGELALAQIYGLRIPIAELDSGQLRQLAGSERKTHGIGRSSALTQLPRASPADPSGRSPTSSRSPACRPVSKSS